MPPIRVAGMDLEAIYRDLHQYPELSFAEHRTAGIIAQHLTALGVQVHTGIGATGVAGVVRNGSGPTVLLRADMDALPIKELTGLPYASTTVSKDDRGNTVPVMHACGHDIHMTCLLGATELLITDAASWSGTLVVVFQPGEEHGGGAQVMVDDGLYTIVPRPDIVLGQHVVSFPAGTLGAYPGAAMAAVDTMEVTLFGRGGHGSSPESTIDPVVMAAATVMRLQTVVSREISPQHAGVVTVGTLHAGTKNNIIAAQAQLGISVRSFDEETRSRLLDGVERVLRAESAASGAPRDPDVEWGERYPVTVNDPAATERVNDAFVREFGVHALATVAPMSASEDVGNLATAAGAPLVYWFLGGEDPQKIRAAEAAGNGGTAIGANHSPHFAPLPQPTIDRGVHALATAAKEFFGSPRSA